MPFSGDFISASDLEKFCYCPLSWWLSYRERKETEDQRKGKKKHQKFGKQVENIKLEEAEAEKSEKIIPWFAIIATIISIAGVTLIPFAYQKLYSYIFVVIALVWLLAAVIFVYKASIVKISTQLLTYERIIVIFAMVAAIIAIYSVTILKSIRVMSTILEVLALVWLIGASFFLYNSLKHAQIAIKSRESARIYEGKVEYVDSAKHKPVILLSEKHKLSGRPDYILKMKDELVPVEIKTGRTPRGPLFSHILQVATYGLILKDLNYKSSYGLLRYEKAEHRIEFTENLHIMVIRKLNEIEKALEKGEVHRNHHRAGKCHNCSRRKNCPERLI